MERYDAHNRYHAWYEHWHRYHWIAPHLKNKIVADLACGEGYGSALLSQSADHVYGFDIDQQTVNLASKKYHNSDRLSYQTANVLHTPLQDASVDAVVSFETLEHLAEHQQLLLEFKRVLRKSGLLVISTPDKQVYSGTGDHNEYHVKELTAEEFQQLIGEHFKHALFFGQQFQLNSLIAPDQSPDCHHLSQALWVAQGAENQIIKNQQQPTYWIAVASDEPRTLDPFKKLSAAIFNDANNSLFEHYETQVRQLLETDKRLFAMQQQLKQQSQVITQLQARLGL